MPDQGNIREFSLVNKYQAKLEYFGKSGKNSGILKNHVCTESLIVYFVLRFSDKNKKIQEINIVDFTDFNAIKHQ